MTTKGISSPCLRQGLLLFIPVDAGPADPKLLGYILSPPPPSCCRVLGSLAHAAMPGFTWVLGIQTEALTLAWPVHYSLRNLSIPLLLILKPCFI